MNILIGVTGSVAAIKLKELCSVIRTDIPNANIKVVMTKTAGKFVCDLTYEEGIYEEVFNVPALNFHYDEEEWEFRRIGDPILHIELRKWADVFIIAPLSANTLGKISNGLCDNLLTNIVRAWDFSKEIIICPAMNTYMWENPITRRQIDVLVSMGFKVIEPVSKRLACNDVGIGAMAPVKDIVNEIKQVLYWHFPVRTYFCSGIPISGHPGSFGYKRHNYMHTGVDLYVTYGCDVYAAEEGVVVSCGVFTGEIIGSPHWNQTDYVMISGKSGVINYGEIESVLKVGDVVKKGEKIGRVVNVLPPEKHRPDIPGHSIFMLHLELYTSGTKEPLDWECGLDQPKNLLDPTQYLIDSMKDCRPLLEYESSKDDTN